jgi:NAD-dependent deacetylase
MAERQDNLVPVENLIKEAASLLAKAQHAIAFTGAGISTPSGIPDFRSPQTGLWQHDDPYQVASIHAFRKNPKSFFDWIRPLAINSASAAPNSAHIALAHLESRGLIKAVITQNIDGLHQKAGSKKVLELHGSAQTATCPSCGKKHSRDYFYKVLTQSKEHPRCNNCDHIIKPDVVLFGEPLPQNTWEKAYQESINADLILVVGSSLEVSPANSLPETALDHGAVLLINNQGDTYLDDRALVLLRMDVELGVGQLEKYLA